MFFDNLCPSCKITFAGNMKLKETNFSKKAYRPCEKEVLAFFPS